MTERWSPVEPASRLGMMRLTTDPMAINCLTDITWERVLHLGGVAIETRWGKGTTPRQIRRER
jgi:hypothetical protein